MTKYEDPPEYMDVSVDTILGNPSKFGVPTFQEFSKNPAKWRDDLNDKFGRIDKSTTAFRNLVEKQTYKIAGFEVKTLEEVERIASNEGINLTACKFCPQIIPQGNGKCRIVVEFKPKLLSRIIDAMGRPFAQR